MDSIYGFNPLYRSKRKRKLKVADVADTPAARLSLRSKIQYSDLQQ